jgi:hypothetical protein
MDKITTTYTVEFTKNGDLFDPVDETNLLGGLRTKPVTDLFVASHGWNNDKGEADNLYDELFANVDKELNAANPGNRTWGLLKVYWPSKKFGVEEQDVAGGGASAGGNADLDAAFDTLASLYQADRLPAGAAAAPSPTDDAQEVLGAIARCRALATSAPADAEDANDMADEIGRLMRALMPADANDEEPLFTGRFRDVDGLELLRALSVRHVARDDSGGGAAAMSLAGGAGGDDGGAAGLFSGLKNGVMGGLNVLTYWKMKERAGKVGAKGLGPLLRRLRSALGADAPRLHLVGHSFGCRVMAATLASGSGADASQAQTVALLQGAFSQFGFCGLPSRINREGHFRRVITERRVKGVMVITHSKKDNAVGLAYPAASRFSNDDASAFGSEDDRFAALGSNGAQNTPESQDAKILPLDQRYAFSATGQWIYNLDGNVTVKQGNKAAIEGHSDIRNPFVARAVASAALLL